MESYSDILLYLIYSFRWVTLETRHKSHTILLFNKIVHQIIILSIYVPSTHAYTHVLRVSLDLPYEKR